MAGSYYWPNNSQIPTTNLGGAHLQLTALSKVITQVPRVEFWSEEELIIGPPMSAFLSTKAKANIVYSMKYGHSEVSFDVFMFLARSIFIQTHKGRWHEETKGI